jgi:hypothetical protein
MKFPYRATDTLSAETGLPDVSLRPEVLIRAIGAGGARRIRALVDTGADECLFPMGIARYCGISTTLGAGPPIRGVGGSQLRTSFGEVTLELRHGKGRIRWRTRAQFYQFHSPDDEVFLLGHSGFLDYFTAVFDGQESVLILTPNDDLLAVKETSF